MSEMSISELVQLRNSLCEHVAPLARFIGAPEAIVDGVVYVGSRVLVTFYFDYKYSKSGYGFVHRLGRCCTQAKNFSLKPTSAERYLVWLGRKAGLL